MTEGGTWGEDAVEEMQAEIRDSTAETCISSNTQTAQAYSYPFTIHCLFHVQEENQRQRRGKITAAPFGLPVTMITTACKPSL